MKNSKLVICLVTALCLLVVGCENRSADKIQPNPQPPQQNTSQPKPGDVVSKQTEFEEPPLALAVGPHMGKWQDLLHKFYQNECAIKEKMRPIFTRQKEIAIWQKYLADLFTESYCQWLKERVISRWVADPMSPVGVPKIYKIESQSDQEAVVMLRIRGKKESTSQPQYKFYRIGLAQIEGRWLVASEEEETGGRHINVSERMARSALGHLAMRKTEEMAAPEVKTGTPQQLLDSMFAVARYMQNEQRKQINAVLPQLVDSLKPFVTPLYYRSLARCLEIQNTGIQMEITGFTRMATPPEPFAKLGEQEECWELYIATTRLVDNTPFRPFHYYFVVRYEQNRWRLHSEAAERYFRLPEPGPLVDNLVNWKLP